MTTTTKLEALMFQKGYIMWGVYFSTNQFVFSGPYHHLIGR
jgi:hypothetical protein